MMRNLLFIVIIFFLIPVPMFTLGTVSLNLGGMYTPGELDYCKPDVEFLTGLDFFHSFTDTTSIFSTVGGFVNYRYLDAEWSYLYNYALDLSFRTDTFLIKPSLKAEGEQFYTQELSTPHIWKNSGELYLSYDIGNASLFIVPSLSWKDDGFLLSGECGYIFSFLINYVMSLEFSAGKSVIASDNDDIYISPKVVFSWYPTQPFTLAARFVFTWYDSDYTSLRYDLPEALPVYDYIDFFMDFEFSTLIGEHITCTVYLPLSLTLKRHNAVEEMILLSQKEWIFSSGLQVDIGFDFYRNHRFVMSLSGEKIFSNSTYQEATECIFSAGYEFLF